MSKALIIVNNLLRELEREFPETKSVEEKCQNVSKMHSSQSISKIPSFTRIAMQTYSPETHNKSLLTGKFITASYDLSQNYIIVYQAFRHETAEYAVSNQKFGGKYYSFTRMTWIKPNYLWMMYRSNWAHSKGQENILAIYLNLENGFLELIKNWVNSRYKDELPYSKKEHTNKIRNPDRIVIQWDPHHAPSGEKIKHSRAIQLGIKGKYLNVFHKNIIKIEDITEFVTQSNQKRLKQQEFEIPIENLLKIDHDIAKNCLIGAFE